MSATPEQRRAALSQAIAAVSGGQVAWVDSNACQAVIQQPKPVNHALHLLITVLLCGLWAPIWLLIYFTRRDRYREHRVSVDDSGEVHTTHH